MVVSSCEASEHHHALRVELHAPGPAGLRQADGGEHDVHEHPRARREDHHGGEGDLDPLPSGSQPTGDARERQAGVLGLAYIQRACVYRYVHNIINI